MKTTIVPAQITSVEDRIAGALTFKQLILLVTPVFMSTALFILLPPFTQFHTYKLFILLFITVTCMVLAIRIRGRLVLEWIVTISRYNLRPLYYVFNKNDASGRDISPAKRSKSVRNRDEVPKSAPVPRLVFSTGDVINFEHTLSNPDADLYFLRSKKGALRVHIKEIK